jgi:hypothetical protein
MVESNLPPVVPMVYVVWSSMTKWQQQRKGTTTMMKITIDVGVDEDCSATITILADQYVGLNTRKLYLLIRHYVPMVAHGYDYVGQESRVVLVDLWPLGIMSKVTAVRGDLQLHTLNKSSTPPPTTMRDIPSLKRPQQQI